MAFNPPPPPLEVHFGFTLLFCPVGWPAILSLANRGVGCILRGFGGGQGGGRDGQRGWRRLWSRNRCLPRRFRPYFPFCRLSTPTFSPRLALPTTSPKLGFFPTVCMAKPWGKMRLAVHGGRSENRDVALESWSAPKRRRALLEIFRRPW